MPKVTVSSDAIDVEERPIKIVYRNRRINLIEEKTIIPLRVWFGTIDKFPGQQWLLDAYDLDSHSEKHFSLKDIKVWTCV
ncbi:MAG: hypothetical protein GY861_22565 [bacterium]|nr:hypothetical protein [bacterium]